MPVTYILKVHQNRAGTRHLEIEVQVGEDEDKYPVEVFDYSMDVPLLSVRRELIGLLNDKYHPEVSTLPGEGIEFTI